MDLLDAVCSPKKSKWEAIMGDEQSRQETYRGACPCSLYPTILKSSRTELTGRNTEAAEWAQKAQICFNECVNSLGPHWDLLKRDDVQTCEELQETGLLQALQLYNLMYGGKALAMGISRACHRSSLLFFLPPPSVFLSPSLCHPPLFSTSLLPLQHPQAHP